MGHHGSITMPLALGSPLKSTSDQMHWTNCWLTGCRCDLLQEEEVDLEIKGVWAIVGIITVSLSAVFVISLVDFFMCL